MTHVGTRFDEITDQEFEDVTMMAVKRLLDRGSFEGSGSPRLQEWALLHYLLRTMRNDPRCTGKNPNHATTVDWWFNIKTRRIPEGGESTGDLSHT